MPAGELFYMSVPSDVREFVMRLLHHALPFATDDAQDAEMLFDYFSRLVKISREAGA